MITAEEINLARRVTEFWAQIRRAREFDCWQWTGYQEDGYGRFFWDGRMVGAHELALTFTTGERRLERLDTCHSCNNPICCNPNHLRFDVRAGNVADMMSAGTYRRGRFSEEQVITMRERYENGAPQQVLADDYGVTNGLVSQIVRGLRYRDFGGPITLKRKYNRNV